ncbi:MAG TPA: hypothetical protein VMP68_11230 [Candidatus Eisenbacteria bacterium]|nr:hypothetical protein [Candidatus Eisenbacteria bacterium]
MRARYTAPTNEALIAIAVRLGWIALTIDCPDRVTSALDTARPRV